MIGYVTDDYRPPRCGNPVASLLKWNRPARGFELRAAGNAILGRFSDKYDAAKAAERLERQGIRVEIWAGEDE